MSPGASPGTPPRGVGTEVCVLRAPQVRGFLAHLGVQYGHISEGNPPLLALSGDSAVVIVSDGRP